MEEGQRPLLVGQFIDALQTAALRSKAAAEGRLRDLYRQVRTCTACSTSAVRQQYGTAGGMRLCMQCAGTCT